MTYSHKLPHPAVLVALIGLTLYVAVTEIMHALPTTMGYDEGWHFFVAVVSPLWQSMLAMSADTHPPLYYPPLRALAHLGSTDPFWPRLLSVIPTILCVPLWYALQRKLKVATVVALTTTAVLASAYSFLHMGVLIRAYAITGFIILAALWFWVDMLPGSSGRPRRRSALMSLLVFSLAMGFLYAGAFATTAYFGAAVLLMLLSADARKQIFGNWWRYSSWPEWVGFFGFHMLIVLWFYLGWGMHVNDDIPLYLADFSLKPDQDVLAFLTHALRLETALFTPLAGLDDWLLDLGATAIAVTIIVLTIINLRAGNYARAAIALAPALLVAVLAFLAIKGKYPFGGNLRHQYVLFPVLLLLLPLALDEVWRRTRLNWLRIGLLLVVLGIALANAVQMQRDNPIGEAPANEMWGNVFAAMFEHQRDEPLFVNAYVFYPTYMNRHPHGVSYRSSYQLSAQGDYYTAHQGALAILLPWTPFEEYVATTDDGGTATFVRDRYRFHFFTMPNERFFNEVRGVLKAMGKDRATIFASREDPGSPFDLEKVRAHAAQFGFDVTEVEQFGHDVLMTIVAKPQ